MGRHLILAEGSERMLPSGNRKADTMEHSPREQQIALWVLVGSQLITGSTYLVAKVGLREMEPFALGFWRFGVTAMIFGVVLAATGRLRRPHPGDWPMLLRLAAWCIPLNQGLFLFGIRDTFASHGALLYATSPMVILVLGTLIGRESASRGKVLGVLVGFGGVILVLAEKGLEFSWTSLHGDAFVFLAVLIWGIYTLENKAALARYDSVYLTGMAMILGTVMFLPIGLPAAWNQDWTGVTWKGVAAVGYLSLLTSTVAYLVWAWALNRLDAVKVAIVANLQPVVAALLGWVVLGERITALFVIGTALVAAGVVRTQKG